MLQIVVYDLNRTLYRKSSKNEFFKFLISKKQARSLNLIQMLPFALLYSLKLLNKTTFKQHFYKYLDGIPPEVMTNLAKEFWDREYPENFRKSMLGDIHRYTSENVEVYIITGAYEVYTKYLENLLGVKVLGTRTSYKNGQYRIEGKACNNEEKVRRLKQEVREDYEILKAYSDDDEEILYEAEKGYFLKGNVWLQVQK
ncbi:phosphoserine phosphatase [Christiangramia fulva]|uniref:Phosphoserine phosphatase n=1 Tax=Christiangramia fulva TaxID=2126553 RepID=A0A2R3Z394_9FLAO|nr:HAD family hydrolase [Christiangramia fulva]AVR44734.1 phosphoserine phosphatase [Christiangramia fulva]